jgi:uncharacterized protein YecE (DUF72 family)
MKGGVYIGTSGWSYEHWRGLFYPEKLPSYKRLAYYCEHFKTVELNVTFYRQPQDATFDSWRRNTPEGFLFSVKASRFITHIKRLREVAEPLEKFLGGALRLKEKLGVILVQLPPGLKKDLSLLDDFLSLLPGGVRFTVEFRNKDWMADDTYEVLTNHNAAFCIYDMPGLQTPVMATADFAYVRFHGGKSLYSSEYSEDEMRDWADKLRPILKSGKDLFVYFNNDTNAYAIANAKMLHRILAKEK